MTSALRLVLILLATQSASPENVLEVLNTINFSVNSAGQTLAAVGMSVLGFVRIIDARRRRRVRRALKPLQQALTGAFPEIRLPHLQNKELDTPTASGYDRCLIEIWDGLIRLSAPLNELVEKRSWAEVQPSDLAAIITTYTTPGRSNSELKKPVAPSPHLLAVLGSRGTDPHLESGIDLLIAISKEIEKNHRTLSPQRPSFPTISPLH